MTMMTSKTKLYRWHEQSKGGRWHGWSLLCLPRYEWGACKPAGNKLTKLIINTLMAMSISRQNQKATYSKSTLLHISLKKREKSAQGKQVLCSQISVMHCSIRIFQNWEISVMAAAFCAWCWENHGDWYHCCRFSDLSHNDCCDELIMLLDIAILR